MEREGSASPRHSDKSHAPTAAARGSSTSAQAAAATAAAFNYSAFLNASVSGNDSVMLGSTENLLRNIQGLLKVAAENARQQDRQANYEKGKKPYTCTGRPRRKDNQVRNDSLPGVQVNKRPDT